MLYLSQWQGFFTPPDSISRKGILCIFFSKSNAPRKKEYSYILNMRLLLENDSKMFNLMPCF